MKQERAESLLKAVNSKPSGYRNGWLLGQCPFGPWRHKAGVDAHPSFAIKLEDKKKSICKCLSCGYGGDLQDLLLDLTRHLKLSPATGYNMPVAASLIMSEQDELDIDGYSIPEYSGKPNIDIDERVIPEAWLATFQPVAKFPEAMTYLQNRGLPLKMLKALDIRFDPVDRRIGFPFRNFEGKLMGLQGRALDSDNPLRYCQYRYKKHYNAHVWMGENTLDLDRPVVLCEGPFDYTSIMRAYQNVAASFTSGLSVAKVKRMADAAHIITFYDYGAGGDAARRRIADILKGVPITHIIPTEEEDDAGAMPESSVASYLKEHVMLTLFNGA